MVCICFEIIRSTLGIVQLWKFMILLSHKIIFNKLAKTTSLVSYGIRVVGQILALYRQTSQICLYGQFKRNIQY